MKRRRRKPFRRRYFEKIRNIQLDISRWGQLAHELPTL
jgi:hypothetical protein